MYTFTIGLLTPPLLRKRNNNNIYYLTLLADQRCSYCNRECGCCVPANPRPGPTSAAACTKTIILQLNLGGWNHRGGAGKYINKYKLKVYIVWTSPIARHKTKVIVTSGCLGAELVLSLVFIFFLQTWNGQGRFITTGKHNEASLENPAILHYVRHSNSNHSCWDPHQHHPSINCRLQGFTGSLCV